MVFLFDMPGQSRLILIGDLPKKSLWRMHLILPINQNCTSM